MKTFPDEYYYILPAMNEDPMKPQAWKIIWSPIPLVTFCSPISSLSAGGIRLNIDVPIVDKPINISAIPVIVGIKSIVIWCLQTQYLATTIDSTRAIPVMIGNKGVIGAGLHSVVFPVTVSL